MVHRLQLLGELEGAHGLPGNRLFYLATDPEFFVPLVAGLAGQGLTRADETRWARIVIEKPFGRDLASALELDRRVLEHLHPEQVYRIDHYLGKDTVQNLLGFRFGNAVFEGLLITDKYTIQASKIGFATVDKKAYSLDQDKFAEDVIVVLTPQKAKGLPGK